jgi:hypothetical protein
VRTWAAAAVLVAAAAGPAQAADREIVRVGELASGSVVLAGGLRPVARSFAYVLPADAAQGPERWYTIRLRFQIRFDPDSGPGFAWVTADTNGRTGAQIEFTTSQRGGRLRVRRTSVDIVNGQLEHVTSSPTTELTFANYLQTRGVRGGRNVWTLRLEQAGEARVERLEVFADTAIVETRRTPYPLGLSGRLLDRTVHVGDTFRVAVALRNRTGERLADVAVVPRFDPAALTLVGRPATASRVLRGTTRQVFAFRARRQGTHELLFLGSSSRNAPTGVLHVSVLAPATSPGRTAAVWTAAAAPAVLVAAWLVRARRRRRAA